MNYYFQTWKKAFDFRGRARRKEYFIFTIINGGIINGLMYTENVTAIFLRFLILALYIIPHIAVSVRRMHDQDLSGWIFLIPIIGTILLFVDGTHGPNRFGPDPKLRNAETDPESMAMRSPVPYPRDIWQCSHCKTRNAAEVTRCATCGRPWR